MKSPHSDSDSEHQPLYDHPDLYERIFPVDEEDIQFLEALLPGSGLILDAGSGPPTMARRLTTPERTVVALDIERALLKGGTGVPPVGSHADILGPVSVVCGDLAQLPFADQSFDAIYSRLFGIAYAMAVHGDQVIHELARVLKPGGTLLAELPIAYRPKRLQGIEERADLECGTYVFRYLDLLNETPWGAVLAADILLTGSRGSHTLSAPIHVYTPPRIRVSCANAGFRALSYHQPLDPCHWEGELPCDVFKGWIRVAL